MGWGSYKIEGRSLDSQITMCRKVTCELEDTTLDYNLMGNKPYHINSLKFGVGYSNQSYPNLLGEKSPLICFIKDSYLRNLKSIIQKPKPTKQTNKNQIDLPPYKVKTKCLSLAFFAIVALPLLVYFLSLNNIIYKFK